MAENTEEKYINLGFTPYQAAELSQGANAGVNIVYYARKDLFAIQMRQIRIGLMEGLPMEQYADGSYDWFQLEEIRKGLERGVDVSKYAISEISYQKMRQVRKGLESKVDLTPYLNLDAGILRELRLALVSRVNIVPYIKAGYDAEQLKEIRIGLEEKLPITKYLEKEFLGASVHEIYLGLKSGVDVSLYANAQYQWNQMREIRLGMEHRVDVMCYVSPYFSYRQMREIRLGMEAGVNVNSYCNLMYTYTEMRKKRKQLEANGDNSQSGVEICDYGAFKIHISEDVMQAQIEVCDKSKLNLDEIKNALIQSGIRKGVVDKQLQLVVSPEYKKRFTIVAAGKLPQSGKDGWYEFCFETEESRKPKVLKDGSVDYQNADWIQVVEEGQLIAQYHEAELGQDGYNVKGRILPSKRGYEQKVLTGNGFQVSEDNKTLLPCREKLK